MTRARAWALARLLVGAAILALLVREIGAAPFTDALHRIHPLALMAALLLGLATTVCCAWRWTLVARALGVPVPLRTAVAAYYRSLFLNSTLPGGVLGDVDRGVSQGRRVGRRRTQPAGRGARPRRRPGRPGRGDRRGPPRRSASPVPRCVGRRWSRCGAAALVAVALVLGRRWRTAGTRGCGPACCSPRSRSSPGTPRPSWSRPGAPGSTSRPPGFSRWPCSSCSRWRCLPASPAGARARARPRGCSARPASAPPRASPSPSCTASWRSSSTLPGAGVLLRRLAVPAPRRPRHGGRRPTPPSDRGGRPGTRRPWEDARP